MKISFVLKRQQCFRVIAKHLMNAPFFPHFSSLVPSFAVALSLREKGRNLPSSFVTWEINLSPEWRAKKLLKHFDTNFPFCSLCFLKSFVIPAQMGVASHSKRGDGNISLGPTEGKTTYFRVFMDEIPCRESD